MRDLHVHTEFSCDSDTRIEEYILKALNTGIKEICFTDHVDLNTNDYGFNYYSEQKFFDTFKDMKAKYNVNIELLAGIEFGEPHLYFEKLNELSSHPYDFIIGSVHWIGDMFPCQKLRKQYLAKEFYTLYWEEVLRTVKTGGFDSLGHIDFPKRYYRQIYYTEAMMSEIFKHLIDKGMVMEINTSTLRKGLPETMPGKELLDIYKAIGGQYVTIGSDAHVVEELGANYNVARGLIDEVGLQEVVYIHRKQMIV